MSADQQSSSQPQSESVWDYPRPPALRRLNATVQIELGGERIAQSDAAYEVLETSHPPTVYLPRSAFVEGALEPVTGRTMCEFKGQAAYFDVVGGEGAQRARAARAAWHYPTPVPAFAQLLDHVAVMPGAMDACFVTGERVQAQDGDFYGGWITSKLRGPFKGAPGTLGW